MSVEAYINFNGNCREAVDFYAGVFNAGQPRFMFYGDMPPEEGFPLTEATRNLVLHVNLQIAGSTVMFSDVPPGLPFVMGNNISLVINSNDTDLLKSLYEKLQDGGSVGMELKETFWSRLYGFVTDRFGIGWQLTYYEPES